MWSGSCRPLSNAAPRSRAKVSKSGRMQTGPLFCWRCLPLVSLSVTWASFSYLLFFFRLGIAPLLVVAMFAAGFCGTLANIFFWLGREKIILLLVFAARLGVT